MILNRTKLASGLIALLVLVSMACASLQTASTPTPGSPPAQPTPTAVPLPPTSIPTAPLPTHTLAPSPTPGILPVSALPVHLGTGLPQGSATISPDNASALALLGLWGLGSPQGLTWSADGSRLVVGFQAGILVFDAQSGSEIFRIRSQGWLSGMDLSPDGQTLAALHAGQSLEFYSLHSGELLASLPEIGINGGISLKYAPDGQSLFVGSKDGIIALVMLQEQEIALSIFGANGYPVENLAISPDQTQLAGFSDEQGMSVWSIADIENPSLLYYLTGTFNSLAILDLAYSPDGHWLASSNWDEWLNLWDVSGSGAPQEGQMLWQMIEGFEPPARWNALAFSADSQTLASGADNGLIWLWDVVSTKPFLSAQVGQAPIQGLAYTPDGSSLAAVYADGTIFILDSSTLEIIHTLQNADAWAGSLAELSADGQYLATATWAYPSDGMLWQQSVDGAGLYLRNFADGSIIRQMDTSQFEIPPSGFTSLGLSPDGRWLAASPLGLPLTVWDTSCGAPAYALEDPNGAFYYCNQVSFSPDGQFVAAACDREAVILWQADTGAFQESWAAETSAPISTLAFSPDGAWLAGAGSSGPVHLWDMTQANPVRLLELSDPAPIHDVFFSPDSQYIACTTGRDFPQVAMWDLQTSELVTSMGFNDRVSTATFSPDSRLLAVAVNFEYADTLEVWDWQNGELLAYEHYYGDILQVFFTPGGRFVVTVSQNGLLHIWGIAPE